MRYATTELALVWRLFRADLDHQRKRIVLTVLAIAWGTLSIVLLLSFGEGLKRSFNKGARGIGEATAVVWPGATTRAYMGLPSGRAVPIKEEDPELLRSRIPEIASLSVEYGKWTPGDGGHARPSTPGCGVSTRSSGRSGTSIAQAGGRFLNERDMAEKRRVVVPGRGAGAATSSEPRTSSARRCRSTSRRS